MEDRLITSVYVQSCGVAKLCVTDFVCVCGKAVRDKVRCDKMLKIENLKVSRATLLEFHYFEISQEDLAFEYLKVSRATALEFVYPYVTQAAELEIGYLQTSQGI